MSNLATNLKKLREEKRISQYKLAEELNIKRSAYGNYETGLSHPEFDVLEKLANYYKVDVKDLLDSNKDFEKELDIKKEAEELKKVIKEHYYKVYRRIPRDETIKKIVELMLER